MAICSVWYKMKLWNIHKNGSYILLMETTKVIISQLNILPNFSFRSMQFWKRITSKWTVNEMSDKYSLYDSKHETPNETSCYASQNNIIQCHFQYLCYNIRCCVSFNTKLRTEGQWPVWEHYGIASYTICSIIYESILLTEDWNKLEYKYIKAACFIPQAVSISLFTFF